MSDDRSPAAADHMGARSARGRRPARVLVVAVVACAVAALVVTGGERPARADGERNKWVALGIGAGATVAPLVLAQAVVLDSASRGGDEPIEATGSSKLVAGVMVAAGLVLGPSAGIAYAGDWKYAGISAGGKTAILGLGFLAIGLRGQGPVDNDYATILPAMAIMVWDAVDFFLIPRIADRHNEELAQQQQPPAAALTFRW